jgi:hypothetical protein
LIDMRSLVIDCVPRGTVRVHSCEIISSELDIEVVEEPVVERLVVRAGGNQKRISLSRYLQLAHLVVRASHVVVDGSRCWYSRNSLEVVGQENAAIELDGLVDIQQLTCTVSGKSSIDGSQTTLCNHLRGSLLGSDNTIRGISPACSAQYAADPRNNNQFLVHQRPVVVPRALNYSSVGACGGGGGGQPVVVDPGAFFEQKVGTTLPLCLYCYQRPGRFAARPCNHGAVCDVCLYQLKKTCPQCRGEIASFDSLCVQG